MARYIHGLSRGLGQHPDVELTLFCRGSRWRRGDPAIEFPSSPVVRWYDWRTPRGFDLFHAPDLRIPRRPPTPLVVTVHDLSSLERTDHATPGFVEKKRLHLARVQEHATRVLTHTDVVRDGLTQRVGLSPDRVVSVPLWPALPRTASEEVGIERSGLLLIGGPSVRKGSERIVAFLERFDASARAGTLPERVRWCGSASTEDAARFFQSLPRTLKERIEWLGHVDDATLDRQLSTARAFVQLSDTEGFGIPLLESAVRRCPVIVWRSATASEVLPADAAFWIGGSDEAEQLAAFGVLKECERRVARAAERGERATIEKTIEATIAVYREAIKSARTSVSAG